MIRAIAREPDGARSGTVADVVSLDFDQRHRRRIMMEGKRGLSFLLDLPHTVRLQHGDALVLEDGRRVAVVAAPEPLYEILGHDAWALARIAWHLGNRHTPAEITPEAIYIQPDHVLAEMVAGLGAHVHKVMRPFDPERGAYDGKGAHSHGHHHHDHDHDHADEGGHLDGHDHDHHHSQSHRHGAHSHGDDEKGR